MTVSSAPSSALLYNCQSEGRRSDSQGFMQVSPRPKTSACYRQLLVTEKNGSVAALPQSGHMSEGEQLPGGDMDMPGKWGFF